MPNTWVPLYNSVSFTHMPYKQCVDNRKWQDELLNKTIKFGGVAMVGVAGFGVYHALKNQNYANLNVGEFMKFFK